MKIEIDTEQFARDIKAGKSIGGKDGKLGSLIKQLTEAVLSAEIDSHLTQDINKNRTSEIEEKILSLFTLGNSYSQISQFMQNTLATV